MARAKITENLFSNLKNVSVQSNESNETNKQEKTNLSNADDSPNVIDVSNSGNQPNETIYKDKTNDSNIDDFANENISINERTLLNQLNPEDMTNSISWGCKFNPDVMLDFEMAVAALDTTKKELINRVIESEIVWEGAHPEFPSQEFIRENLAKKKEEELKPAAFILTKDNQEFLRKTSKKCGMKMYQFLEWLVEEYL